MLESELVIGNIIQTAIALGTVGALFAALYQIWHDKDQARKEERESQAIKVAAWFEDVSQREVLGPFSQVRSCNALILNDNIVPIYDVVVTVVGLHGAGPCLHGEDNEGEYPHRAVIPQLSSGLWAFQLDAGGAGMGVVVTLEISFRDGNGRFWIRRGSGELVSIDEDPLTYYSIPLPANWTYPMRVSQSG